MPQTIDDIAALNGLHKSVFGDRLEKAIPMFAKATKAISWDSDKEVGKEYKFPVILVSEGGISRSEPEDSGFDLQPAINGIIREASLKPYAHVGRAKIAYSAAFQAGASNENSKKAYASATGVVIQNLMDSQAREIELDILGYGRDGIGEVAVNAANVITFTDASWAAGAWPGRLGHKLEFFSAQAETSTKRAGAGSDSLGTGYYTITAIDIANKQITLDDSTNIVAGDHAYTRMMKSATLYKSMVGLSQILGSTGTLFGIVGSTYELFTGNTYSVGGNLSVPDVLAALAQIAPKGGEGEFQLWCSPLAYSVINSDMASLVQFDGNKHGPYKMGSDSLMIKGSTGSVSISSHTMMKDGHAFLWQPKNYFRSGTTPPTLDRSKIQGGKGAGAGQYFTDSPDAASYVLRSWSSQFIGTAFPGRGCLLTDIVNT